MKKLSIFLCSLILLVCSFTFVGCGEIDTERVTGTYYFIGGWFGDESDLSARIEIIPEDKKVNGYTILSNVITVPENIKGNMDTSSFYVEITKDKIIEHGNIQYSNECFLYNQNTSNEYEYKLTSRNNSVESFNIQDKDGNSTNFSISENIEGHTILTYYEYFEGGNVFCLTFRD